MAFKTTQKSIIVNCAPLDKQITDIKIALVQSCIKIQKGNRNDAEQNKIYEKKEFITTTTTEWDWINFIYQNGFEKKNERIYAPKKMKFFYGRINKMLRWIIMRRNELSAQKPAMLSNIRNWPRKYLYIKKIRIKSKSNANNNQQIDKPNEKKTQQ